MKHLTINSIRNLFVASIVSAVAMMAPTTASAAGPKLDLEKANNSILDQDSLRRGAIIFANRCMSCHSVKYMRYNRLAKDLGWSDEEALKKLNKTRNKPVDNMMGAMPAAAAKAAYGTEIPDLSLMARVKGTDYIYTFIRGFELNKETGKWDNKLLKGTVMPNIMPKPPTEKGMEQYDQDTRDLANFLEYVGEPAKLKRLDLGWKVMLFLLVLIVLTYLLKKEYWRDVKH